MFKSQSFKFVLGAVFVSIFTFGLVVAAEPAVEAMDIVWPVGNAPVVVD